LYAVARMLSFRGLSVQVHGWRLHLLAHGTPASLQLSMAL
jgi:hypothetical protein